MKQPKPMEHSAKATASLVTGGGLVLVWAIVWTNFPSKEELLSVRSVSSPVETSNAHELDLTIPGVSDQAIHGPTDTGGLPRGAVSGRAGAPPDSHARQIAELRCDAQIQEVCPDTLTGHARARCMMQGMRGLDPPCQDIARQRVMRWKAVDGYRLACASDIKRVCPAVESGEGRILACLQEHEQALTEICYQSLPKGRLNFRN